MGDSSENISGIQSGIIQVAADLWATAPIHLRRFTETPYKAAPRPYLEVTDPQVLIIMAEGRADNQEEENPGVSIDVGP